LRVLGLTDLPATLKFVYGMVSDGTSINGYRRKPWMALGWIGFSYVNFCLFYEGSPGITKTIVMSSLAVIMIVMSEVCQDTMCVERGYLEAGKCLSY